tara:strand:+ start:1335 stop:1712 length:378 start_codon:yes stop_codon:yes gene_type:complete
MAKITPGQFLKGFAEQYNKDQGMVQDKSGSWSRGTHTAQAKSTSGQGGAGGITINQGGGGGGGMSSLATDVKFKQGDDLERAGHRIPGDPGSKGFLGTAVRFGSNFLPGVGPMVGQAVAPHLDYV